MKFGLAPTSPSPKNMGEDEVFSAFPAGHCGEIGVIPQEDERRVTPAHAGATHPQHHPHAGGNEES